MPDVPLVDVFVLEDEMPVRMVLIDALESVGYRTTGFGDGASALERLAEITPALIMLDMRMPRMDGFEFLTKLRANPDWTRIPVVIVSGLGDELLRAIDASRADSLGVVGIFAKPFDLPTLLRYVALVVAGQLGRRR